MEKRKVFVFLHGFGSSPSWFEKRRKDFEIENVSYFVPDLNFPSFSELKYSSK